MALLLHHVGTAQTVPATVNTTRTYIPEVMVAPTYQPTQSLPGRSVHIDQMPVFQGGTEALHCFLYQNNRLSQPKSGYPTGIVFVGLVVDTAGRVRDVRILRGLHPALDAEALRLTNLLSGRFTPGQNNKRLVAVPLTLPVRFPAIAPVGRKQQKRCASSFTTSTR
ncbi:energy transducer TonB [Hymenobacter yonginensis]|uniref:Energy transducer TonB n=1 Tax=Hymenobacter yonginensis TaxID=748197 RepID=A0ABY7PMD4_9BACT|nr:energy transducer TonB [Hymenobacter yonginensis]WBO83881.1 energy transducer TonB [Hymenobacter yonginensis]